MPLSDTLRDIDRMFKSAADDAAEHASPTVGPPHRGGSLRNLAAVAALATAAAVHAQPVQAIYVDDDAPLGGDGGSWATAFRDLQDALSVAASRREGRVFVVKVAQGVYTPDRGTGDRASSFNVSSGTTLMGAFAGLGAVNPDLRDLGAFVTVLSGDLQHDDGPSFEHTSDNSYHVVDQRLQGSTISTIPEINGVTISGGNALDAGVFGTNGAGVATSADFGVNLIGCRLTRNQAVNGGAVDWVSPGNLIVDCAFDNNFASSQGGAAACHVSVHMENCRFENNRAVDGGAVYGAIIGRRCVFLRNSASGSGGAARGPLGSSLDLQSCLLAGNSADIGGALNAESLINIAIACTIVGNAARIGGAVVASRFEAYGSIFWGNASEGAQIVPNGQGESRTFDLGQCIVQGGDAAIGLGEGATIRLRNILAASPKFVSPAGLDGDLATVEDNDYRLSATSPAIDFNGVPLEGSDLAGAPRVHDDPGTPNFGPDGSSALDLGPYEFQGTSCRADYDASGVVSVGDVFAYLHDWFIVSPDADFNRSGQTDLGDLFDFLAAYFAGCP